jgi:hypothetical protein
VVPGGIAVYDKPENGRIQKRKDLVHGREQQGQANESPVAPQVTDQQLHRFIDART